MANAYYLLVTVLCTLHIGNNLFIITTIYALDVIINVSIFLLSKLWHNALNDVSQAIKGSEWRIWDLNLCGSAPEPKQLNILLHP